MGKTRTTLTLAQATATLALQCDKAEESAATTRRAFALHLLANAEAIGKALFPEGPAGSGKKTRALSAVWKEWADAFGGEDKRADQPVRRIGYACLILAAHPGEGDDDARVAHAMRIRTAVHSVGGADVARAIAAKSSPVAALAKPAVPATDKGKGKRGPAQKPGGKSGQVTVVKPGAPAAPVAPAVPVAPVKPDAMADGDLCKAHADAVRALADAYSALMDLQGELNRRGIPTTSAASSLIVTRHAAFTAMLAPAPAKAAEPKRTRKAKVA